MDFQQKENRLIKVFLSEYKKLIEERTGIEFHPRTLAVVSQPDMKNANVLHWLAYNRWFDEVDIGVSNGNSNNLIQAFLEIPIHILITAEEINKPLLSSKDQRKLAKALKLIGEIKLEPQNEKN